MNETLCDVMLNNIITNAIRHNVPGGQVFISLKKNKLTVSNTGRDGALQSANIFSRFYKENPSSEYNGLGLSIVKEIGEVSGLRYQYFYANHLHIFIIEWNTR